MVVSAVPGFMGYRALDAIIRSGKTVVDISFFPEDALQLHQMAADAGVTAIVDCGVAPGLSNLVLGYCDSIMKVDSFECMVGGLPKVRTWPFALQSPILPDRRSGRIYKAGALCRKWPYHYQTCSQRP